MNDSSKLMEKIKQRLLNMDLFTQMDKAKELVNFALTHQAIARQDKEELTYWLQSFSATSQEQQASRLRQLELEQLRPASPAAPAYRSTGGPPQVTISGVTGHIVQYNALSSPVIESRASRPWRSNSLTPPSTNGPHLTMAGPDWAQYQPKGRSHSLTYVTDSPESNNLSPASSTTTMDEKEVEELLKHLPNGSGMKEIREWLKSLRLHKYTKILLEMTYEELLELSDESLEKKNVTLGARGKILKNIGLIKERPQKLRELARALEDVSTFNDTEGLIRILRELEAIVLMPLKPFTKHPWNHHQPQRHDSGASSDSGTEHDLETYEDMPGKIFDILKSISTEIFVKEYTNHEVITVFACLLDKCLKREAYTPSQKHLITGWLGKLKTLWNPPHIKKATDYKKRPFRCESSCPINRANSNRQQQQSYLRSSPSQLQPQSHHQQLPLNPNPVSSSPAAMSFKTASTAFSSSNAAASVSANKMALVPESSDSLEPHLFGAEDALGMYYSPRRSMPEIKANHHQFLSQIKRNSYQEEGTFNLDAFGINQPGGNGSYFGGFKQGFNSIGSDHRRRESSISTDSGFMMSLPESRRDSEVSSDFRANSGIRRDSDNMSFLTSLEQQQQKLKSPYEPRRDSGMSDDYLRVDHVGAFRGANMRGGIGGGTNNGSSTSSKVGVIGSSLLKNPGSMSSGCASDGSTDSLLEQDLHLLSLAMTQQALE